MKDHRKLGQLYSINDEIYRSKTHTLPPPIATSGVCGGGGGGGQLTGGWGGGLGGLGRSANCASAAFMF